MAKIITVAQTKGGVSKSTLTYFLYQYFAGLGSDVAILDLDLQKTITQLNERFDKGLRIIAPKNTSKVHELDIDFVFVDTPPYRVGDSEKIFAQSDFVLIPVTPSYLDAMATETIIEDLKKFKGIKYAAVLTQVRKGTSYNQQIKEVLTDMELPLLNTIMHQRVAYARGILREDLKMEENSKAINEIGAIANEILTLMVAS